MKLNSKGFTLAELLAVIVVLSVIITIATVNVIPSFKKSKQKALYNDAITMSEAAYNRYLDELLDRTSVSDDIYNHATTTRDGYKCYDIRTSLIGKYAETSNSNLSGTVEVCTKKDCTYKTKVWIKTNEYVVVGKTEKQLSSGTYKDVVVTYSNQKTNKCADSTN